MRTCLTVGGIGCLVMLLVLVLAGFFIVRNAKSLLVNVSQSAAHSVVDASHLSTEQKTALKKEITQLGDEVKAGDITVEQVGQVMEQLTEGPLLMVGMLHLLLNEHIKNSALSEAEKEAARKTVSRLCHGGLEGDITQEKLQQLMNQLGPTAADGNSAPRQEVKEQLTPEELAQVLEAAKRYADEAAVPDQMFDVDLASKLRQIIDEVRRGTGAGATDELPAELPEQPAPATFTPQ